MSEKNAAFPCGGLTLEGVWHLPEDGGIHPAVIVCHPHPLYGGDMANNIVMAICRALVARNMAAFRFNFRGVGRSEGAFGGGVGEQDDVGAALNFVSADESVNANLLGLSGYSFGGAVALSAARKDRRVKALGLVSPGLSPPGWEKLGEYPRAKFVLLGGMDAYIPLTEVQSKIAG
ncbi:MAG: alpha/beta hydrolase, partial [Chloroflexota bacterium]